MGTLSDLALGQSATAPLSDGLSVRGVVGFDSHGKGHSLRIFLYDYIKIMTSWSGGAVILNMLSLAIFIFYVSFTQQTPNQNRKNTKK